MTKGKMVAVLAVVAMLLALPAMVLAQAQPPRPAVFGGTARIQGATAPNGTVVTAFIDSTAVSTATVSGGNYALIVAQPTGQNFAGKTVTFTVGNATATETGTWQASGGGELNLNGTAAPAATAVPAAPTATPVPAPVTTVKGEKGDTGSKGDPGLPGPKGDPGPAGTAGSAGSAGSGGPQGPAGAPGAKGDAGAAGGAGAAGPAGAQGGKGAPGEAGPPGEAAAEPRDDEPAQSSPRPALPD